MVMMLTAASIVAVLAVAGALVVRVTRPGAPASDASARGADTFAMSAVAAETLVLPQGEAVTAAGGAPGALMLVTRDDSGVERLRLFDAATGAPGPVAILRRAP